MNNLFLKTKFYNLEKLTFRYLLFISLMLIALTACGPESKFLGRWLNEDGTTTIEFLNDGVIITTQQSQLFGKTITSGTYKLLDDTRMQVTSQGGLFGGSSVLEYQLAGDTLNFKIYGMDVKYTRIR
jgi:hypothetical protein